MVLEVSGVSKSFDGEEIIRDITLNLKEGEIVSLLGVSGGGKTTLFNLIAGLRTPDEGTIQLEGVDITGKPGNISYMLQKDLLLPYKTIVDNVALPLRSVLFAVSSQSTRVMLFLPFGLPLRTRMRITISPSGRGSRK